MEEFSFPVIPADRYPSLRYPPFPHLAAGIPLRLPYSTTSSSRSGRRLPPAEAAASKAAGTRRGDGRDDLGSEAEKMDRLWVDFNEEVQVDDRAKSYAAAEREAEGGWRKPSLRVLMKAMRKKCFCFKFKISTQITPENKNQNPKFQTTGRN